MRYLYPARYGTSWPGNQPGVRHWLVIPLFFRVSVLRLLFLWLPLALVLGFTWAVAEFWILVACGIVLALKVAEGWGPHLDWAAIHWEPWGHVFAALIVPPRETGKHARRD